MSQHIGADSEGLQAMPNHNAPEALLQDALPLYPDRPAQQNPAQQPPQWDTSKEHSGKTYPYSDLGSGTIFSLRKTTLVLALLFLAAAVAAIVVGAVLGTRSTSSSCPSPTTTTGASQTSLTTTATASQTSSSNTSTTATTATPFVAPTGVIVALDCPAIDGTTVNEAYNPTGNFYKYQITCGQDCHTHDLLATWAYSLDMCVGACVSFTRNNYTGMSCGAVAFRADMGNVSGLGGNCYLKQGGCVP
ncbi:hypothetical protein LOCC1_G004976 [Lachnellula occidentalis]|uniref:WSC domain-containing protein n=1 Tax=Lachnellula occidentalis TaxID=215460 RepID=A0A8H8S0G1_9HELO|nr:hypothetical protein LOCC1_G004976 [Lachnellula occidentalis]